MDTRFLSTGIRASVLGGPVPKTMQSAAKGSESEWEKSMKRITQNLKDLKRLVKKTFPRRRRLPVWEDNEARWWRRRRRSSMEDWPPNVRALLESNQDEEEEKEEVEEEEEEEEEDNDGETVVVDHPSQNSDPVEVEKEEVSLEEIKHMATAFGKEVGVTESVGEAMAVTTKITLEAENEPPTEHKENVFRCDNHFAGRGERGLATPLPWQNLSGGEKAISEKMERCRCLRVWKEVGSPLRRIAGEACRKVARMPRTVFDGGGKEPPSRCGRLPRGDGDDADCVGRHRYDNGDRSGSREKDNDTVGLPVCDADGDDIDVDIEVDVDVGNEEDRGESVNLCPPPELPHSEGAETAAALTDMVAVERLTISYGAGARTKEEARGGALQNSGQKLNLMGQAQLNDRTEKWNFGTNYLLVAWARSKQMKKEHEGSGTGVYSLILMGHAQGNPTFVERDGLEINWVFKLGLLVTEAMSLEQSLGDEEESFIAECFAYNQTAEKVNFAANGVTTTELRAFDSVLQPDITFKTLNLLGNPLGDVYSVPPSGIINSCAEIQQSMLTTPYLDRAIIHGFLGVDPGRTTVVMKGDWVSRLIVKEFGYLGVYFGQDAIKVKRYEQSNVALEDEFSVRKQGMEYLQGNDISREQELGAGGILSDSISILEKGLSSWSRDLQTPSDLGEHLSSAFSLEDMHLLRKSLGRLQSPFTSVGFRKNSIEAYASCLCIVRICYPFMKLCLMLRISPKVPDYGDEQFTLEIEDFTTYGFSTFAAVSVTSMFLSAARLGLNRVATCHVLMLDPWWYPMTRDQALDQKFKSGSQPLLLYLINKGELNVELLGVISIYQHQQGMQEVLTQGNLPTLDDPWELVSQIKAPFPRLHLRGSIAENYLSVEQGLSTSESIFFKIWDPGGSLLFQQYWFAFQIITLRTR